MPVKDKRVDEYIDKAPQYAKPIIKHLRKLVHTACPDCTETIKWSFACFDYSGSILCSIAAFKSYCAFGFWKYSIMTDPYNLLQEVGETSMGNFGKITSLDDLPKDEIIIEYIMEAAKLNKDGIKLPKKTKSKVKKEVEVPDYFQNELKKNKDAFEIFNSSSYTFKKDYVDWLNEAKTDETRNKRITMSIEWISEGKGRNWKYERKK